MFESNYDNPINIDFITDTNKLFASCVIDASSITENANSDYQLKLNKENQEIGLFNLKIGKDKIKLKKNDKLSKQSTTKHNASQSSPIKETFGRSSSNDSTSKRINSKHHMSAYTFADPMNIYPGPSN